VLLNRNHDGHAAILCRKGKEGGEERMGGKRRKMGGRRKPRFCCRVVELRSTEHTILRTLSWNNDNNDKQDKTRNSENENLKRNWWTDQGLRREKERKIFNKRNF
jgi:hypothetical protein